MLGLFGFRVIGCGLSHEEFVATGFSSDTRRTGVERRGFCRKDLRNKSLSCAHSMSWVYFLEQLKKYPDIYQRKQVQASLEKMDRIRAKIFKLDHRKGELEKQKLTGDKAASAPLGQLHEDYDVLIR
jgi:hypothetical protein